MSDWCEYPEFYHETFPKARKEHKCIECFAPIEVGEKHLHYRGKWGGDFSQGRQHMLCRELCMFIRDRFNHGECIPFGGLRKDWKSFSWGIGARRDLEDRERQARSLMARIKWRERKYL